MKTANRAAALLAVALLANAPGLGIAANVAGKVTLKAEGGRVETDASNIVVYLEHPDGSGFDLKKVEPIHKELLSQDKQFAPMVVPVTAGSKVDFLNEDPIMHNAFSLSRAKHFDLGLYKKGSRQAVTFNKPGLVKVYCNIHENMVAYVPVLDTPYYGLTDTDGRFEIYDVPPGEYQVMAWHRFADSIKHPLTVKESGTTVNLELTETNTSTKHRNKWDKDYQNKY